MNKMHMMDKPYIRAVIQELVNLGYADEDAKEVSLTLPRIDGHEENLYNKSWRGSYGTTEEIRQGI